MEELDSFTQKLLERTQARRENLNKKMAETPQMTSKRRREPLTEQNLPNESSVPQKACRKSIEDCHAETALAADEPESQGFTKSPSASKLSFAYNNASKPVATVLATPTILEEGRTDAEVEKVEVKSTNSTKENAKPSLTVAERRAMFEKAQQQPKEVVPPELLSVAARAALFEKASSGGTLPRLPNKVKVPVKQTFSVPQLKPAVIENTNHISALTTNTANTASIVTVGSVGERKSQLAALLGHWENASSQSRKESSSQISVGRLQRASESDDGKKKNSQDESDISETCNMDHQSVESSKSIEEMSEESEVSSETEEPEEESTQDEESVSIPPSEVTAEESTHNMSEEEQAVCNEIDELLDDALDTTCSDASSTVNEPLGPPLKCETTLSAYKSPVKCETTLSVYHSPVKPPRGIPETCTEPVSVSNQEEMPLHEPLTHTISFYRRQQSQSSTPKTPVHTIVRKEDVASPPFPSEADVKAVVQERIKILNEEVQSQQRIISQSSQALNLCHATTEFYGSSEQVEGEKLLLISTQKRQACLNEIQRLKTEGVMGPDKYDYGKGTLTISDIRLPLKRDFLVAHIEGKIDDDVHYFICLIRHSVQIIATQMLSTQDNITGGVMSFSNHITLHELNGDFQVAFEVYALQTKKETLPHERKYHIRKESSKLWLTPKSKKESRLLTSPAVSSPGGPSAVRSSSFGLIGSVNLNLGNCGRKAYTLGKLPFASPLEGTVMMKVQLHAKHDIIERGFLTMFEDISGFGAWHRRWSVLKGNHLAYWKYPDDENRKDPMGILDLRSCITGEVCLVSRDICARPNTFHLVTVRPPDNGDKDTLITRRYSTLTTTRHLFSADTKEERILWCRRLNMALTSIRKWDPEALRPIDMNQLE